MVDSQDDVVPRISNQLKIRISVKALHSAYLSALGRKARTRKSVQQRSLHIVSSFEKMFSVLVFETRLPYVAQAGLYATIPLPRFPVNLLRFSV